MNYDLEDNFFTQFERGINTEVRLFRASQALQENLSRLSQAVALHSPQFDHSFDTSNVNHLFNLWRDSADMAFYLQDNEAFTWLMNFSKGFRLDDFNKPWLIFYAGEALTNQNNFTQASLQYAQAVADAQHNNNFTCTFRGLLALSRSLYNLGNFRAAENQAIRVLTLTEQPPYLVFHSVAQFYLAQHCAKTGNLVGAEWYCREAFKTAIKGENPETVCFNAGELLARLLHSKIYSGQDEEVAQTFFETEKWLRKASEKLAPTANPNALMREFLVAGLYWLKHFSQKPDFALPKLEAYLATLTKQMEIE